MTTIHTIEDLLSVLDEKPEWVEALRARLLTPELLNLPEKFAQFSAEMNKFVAETNKFVAETKKFMEEMNKFVAATDRRFDSLENRVQSIQDDVGTLKGAHARSAALREAPFIAGDMGLRWVKDLTPADLWALTDRAPADIPANELNSFRRADLIVEATNLDSGEPCYIAVEISFTANGRNTTRALRNAAFLTQFTGRRSYPAIASLRRDHRIEGVIESGEVFWYQLDREILEAE
ncbi:MAG: hypothetical protein F4Z57_23035 [Gemmatimonadetes bacterium]|nr:hypothetical protein [Gemmatimonadota bacterium]MYC73722.1 hypothetical protein [Gemmatimonadota bacterium]MYI63652.1 hypothetical protein [Gemmatimonadota bacterium]